MFVVDVTVEVDEVVVVLVMVVVDAVDVVVVVTDVVVAVVVVGHPCSISSPACTLANVVSKS